MFVIYFEKYQIALGERESVCVWKQESEREWVKVYVCVCVCVCVCLKENKKVGLLKRAKLQKREKIALVREKNCRRGK